MNIHVLLGKDGPWYWGALLSIPSNLPVWCVAKDCPHLGGDEWSFWFLDFSISYYVPEQWTFITSSPISRHSPHCIICFCAFSLSSFSNIFFLPFPKDPELESQPVMQCMGTMHSTMDSFMNYLVFTISCLRLIRRSPGYIWEVWAPIIRIPKSNIWREIHCVSFHLVKADLIIMMACWEIYYLLFQ